MKAVICAIAKNENNYINEWANYYIKLGFEHIYLYDNNDASTKYVGEYISSSIRNKITIINKNNIHEQGLQWKVYQEFYTNFNKQFDWCLFCDIDEFLVGVQDINIFLSQSKFRNIEQIRVRWNLYGDDDIIVRDASQPVFGAFKKIITDNMLSKQGKAIVRGGLSNIVIKSCHYAFRSTDNGKTRYELQTCLPSGVKSVGSTFEINDDYSHEEVFLNHYMTKSLSEFINQKLFRGDAVWADRKLKLDYFWQLNKKTSAKETYINNTLFNIDLVVPYVDESDASWQKIANENNIQLDLNRFRGQGNFFRYFFRAVEKNMPWLNKIFLVVSELSQVPEWIDSTKVEIIIHKEFIPKKYLPTFNSTTIEMFLWAIPGLSEHFIYANDDFFALTPYDRADFFKDGCCCFNLKEEQRFYNNSPYWHHCLNSYNLIYHSNNFTDKYLRLDHEFRPYLKSSLKKCFNLHKSTILNSISAVRTNNNFNCYLYSLYIAKTSKQLPSRLINSYVSGTPTSYKLQADMACINDDSATNIYENDFLRRWFYLKFPNKSSYELTECPELIAIDTDKLTNSYANTQANFALSRPRQVPKATVVSKPTIRVETHNAHKSNYYLYF